MHLLPVRSHRLCLSRSLLGLCLVLMLLAGCSPAAPTAVSPAEAPTKPAAQTAPTEPPAQPPSAPAAAKATATLAPTASPVPAYPKWSDLKQLPAEAMAKPETYQSGVLYLERGSGDGTSYPLSLVLLKMDQQTYGRVTPEGLPTALYHPNKGAVKMISYGTPAEVALIKVMGWESVLAPELCRPPEGWPANKGDFIPCTNYTFSSDGRYLAYQIPSQSSCGGQLKILGLEKRMHVISEKTGGLWSLALPSGSILYAVGHCEGGMIMRFDAKTGKNSTLAELPAGGLIWNPQHTAFVAMVGDEVGNQVSLWGFNTENNSIFFRVRPYTSNEFDDSPTWTPDGKTLLFRRLAYQPKGGDAPSLIFEHPSQIVKVDVATGAQSVVTPSFKENYFMCDSSGMPCGAAYWSGDFFQLRRTPFEAVTWTSDVFSLSQGSSDSPEVNCRLYGRDCQPQAEPMAYNYKTDKIIPWAETGLPADVGPKPQEFPRGPAADAKAVYEDSAGAYRLVPGPNSLDPLSEYPALYLVPKSGEPVIFVEAVAEFITLP